ncbi:serine hydrolase [Nocardiopsis sp. RSe5-2]|uniref:Serine hydrolase n=1 Tax=Nocardiopsis endophytica TaxID=3018445 RepID=A0ABT4U052_9ACTN|nr:serine hydrolase domain-containing protein [Nocardiopsis endophytica]MDA2810326.1 serine hydrolase [Nocardiopsis endophytica]
MPPVPTPRTRPAAKGLAALAAAALLAAGPVPAAADAGTATTAAPELTAADVDAWLDDVVPESLQGAGVPGAAVSVVADGELLTARGYGEARTGADGGRVVPVDPEETLFRPGSVSKLFTATAVMRLVEEGEVDLDTDVREYLDFDLPTRFDEPVTLRHLLSHTAGFEDRFAGMMLPEGQEPDLRAHLSTDPPEQVYEPGTVPSYSNYGNALAGYVVENVSGTAFEDYVAREVLEPLGMDSSTFEQPLPGALEERMAGGYADASAPAEPFETIADVPAGGMTTSATDMARFMLAQLDALEPGRNVLEPRTLELMQSPALDESSLGALAEGPRMTLGLFEEDRNGRRVLGHGGDTAVFHSHLTLYPDDGVGIFVALNGGDALTSMEVRDALRSGFADRYLPAEDAQEAAVEPTAAEHAQMAAGTYETSQVPHSTFMNAMSPLGAQTRITAREDGTILLTPSPDTMTPVAYEEVAPWVWQEVDGQRRIAMRVEDGRVEAIGYNSAFTLLPVAAHRDSALTLPVLAASAAVLLAAAVSWPVGAVLRRRSGRPARDRAGRTARVLTRIGAGSALVALGGWTAAFLQVMTFAPMAQDTLRAVLVAQLIGVAGVVPAAVVLVGDVRRRAGWKRCLGSALVLLALAGTAFFAAAHSMLSFDLTY